MTSTEQGPPKDTLNFAEAELWIANGLAQDMIPLRHGDKKPIVRNWPEMDASPELVRKWALAGRNLGLRTRRVVAIDVEHTIFAPFLASLIKAKWRDAPQRFRPGVNSTAFLLRLPEGVIWRKAKLSWMHMPESGKDTIVEILGKGQQLHVVGDRADCDGARLTWEGLRPFDEIPLVTPDELDALLEELREAVEMFYGVPTRISGAGSAPEASSLHEVETWPAELIYKALDAIPNDDLDYDAWMAMLCAVHNASNGSEEGWDAFCEWSAKSGKHDEGLARYKWDRYSRGERALSAGYIRQQLEACGAWDLRDEVSSFEVAQAFDDDVSQQGAAEKQEKAKKAEDAFDFHPFVLGDLSKIPRRQFLYGHHYIRKFLSCTVAPGGVGKSSLTLVEAVAMAIGRKLLDADVKEPLRVWVWNGEDPMDELQRRIGAIVLQYGIEGEELERLQRNLFVDSGRQMRIKVAHDAKAGAEVDRRLIARLKQRAIEHRIDVMILDPFIASHAVTESDNNAIAVVAYAWANIADECNLAVELVHHVRKGQAGRGEITVDDGRGAVALKDAARSMRVLNPMTKDDAKGVGVPQEKWWAYFREDDGKANLAPPDKTRWRKLESIELPNGDAWEDGEGGDRIGVVTFFNYAGAAGEAMDEDYVQAFLEALRESGGMAKSALAADWAGLALGEAMGLDPKASAEDRARVSFVLKSLVQSGQVVEKKEEAPGRGKRVRPVLVAASQF